MDKKIYAFIFLELKLFFRINLESNLIIHVSCIKNWPTKIFFTKLFFPPYSIYKKKQKW